ncbi:MAG TPA: hypothetical protein VLZ51_11695 [Brevundimonas sp.]|nr:hypothetical protein [Brevundimonas sp.]
MRLTAPLLALSMALAVAACGPSDPAPKPAVAPAAAPAPEMPVDAPPQEEVGPDEGVDEVAGSQASAASCLSDIGATASARLVERCRAVSPATRPPCNAANPCALIQGEIDRSCGQYGPGETKPAECAA